MSTVGIVAALLGSHLVDDFHALFGALFPAAKTPGNLLHSFLFKVIDQGLGRRRAEILGYLFDSLINLFGNGDGCLYEAHFSLLTPIIGLDGNTVKEYQLIISFRKIGPCKSPKGEKTGLCHGRGLDPQKGNRIGGSE